MKRTFIAALLVGLCCSVAAALSVVFDLTGTFALTVIDSFDNCTYAGPLEIEQTGSSFTGSFALKLVSGACPATADGDVSGMISGNAVQFGVANGPLGSALFNGLIAPGGNLVSGSWSTPGDPAGTWVAKRGRQSAPAASSTGLVLLAALLGAAGVFGAARTAARRD